MATKAALLACTAATVLAGAFLTAATWSPAGADDLVTHHEFQVNCSPSHHQPDDPIVFPGLPGASHDHTFLGNKTTNATTTLQSLQNAGVGNTTCLAPDDLSAYWFPTVLNGNQVVLPNFAQVVYYKSGILDYTKVVPFPPGLRYVAGSVTATQDEFQHAPGAIEGWECGDSFHNWDIPVRSRASSAATASRTGTSRRTAWPAASSTSASRHRVAGTGSTWTRPTTRATWRTRTGRR